MECFKINMLETP